MILVVEGISASGKSRWCADHAPCHTIPENGRIRDAPDRTVDPHGAAAFWAERNVDRWQAALAMERARSRAVCDTDPLKLHYIWGLWRIGEASERDWLLERAATRRTMAEGRIGFADGYVLAHVGAEVARRRALADPTRRRRALDLHLRLQEPLAAWYAALDTILPGRVRIALPVAMPPVTEQGGRYDVAAFDALLDALR